MREKPMHSFPTKSPVKLSATIAPDPLVSKRRMVGPLLSRGNIDLLDYPDILLTLRLESQYRPIESETSVKKQMRNPPGDGMTKPSQLKGGGIPLEETHNQYRQDIVIYGGARQEFKFMNSPKQVFPVQKNDCKTLTTTVQEPDIH